MRLKKFLAVALSCILVAGCFSGCSKTDKTESTETGKKTENQTDDKKDGKPAIPEDLSGTLNIWSFTNELRTMTVAFMKKYPNVKVNYTMIPMDNGEYQQKVKAALGTSDAPDVIALEGTFIREFVESDFLADLSEYKPFADELATYQYTIDAGTDPDGKIKAWSYQACPGAFFYRRSLAKEYFGTDNPDEIQKHVENMDEFKKSAQTIKEKSNGNTYMISGAGDFTEMYLTNREQPWIVDDKLVIDPKVTELLEISKQFRDNEWEAQAGMWSEGWFAGMKDALVDAAGNPKKVFGYFLPTWGLPYVLMSNAKSETTDTAGDWAACPGPMGYRNGGTWLGVIDGAKNAEIAKEFTRFATLDEENLKNWATGVYTHDYLKAIDSTIPDDLAQAAGDFLSSKKVVEEVMDSMKNSPSTEFLGGQNAYEMFAQAASKVSLKTMQGSDATIALQLNSAVGEYAMGNMSLEEAMQLMKDGIATSLPDITID